MQTLDLELRSRLAKYLGGELPIEELHRWVTAEAWNIGARVDAETARTFHEVELLLAEHAHGDWSEDELKERLTAFVTSYVVRSGAAQASTSTRTVSVNVLLGSTASQVPA